MSFKSIALLIAGLGLLLLGACSNGNNQATAPAPNPAVSPVETTSGMSSNATMAKSKMHGGQGGQVIESGDYHLEFMPEKAEEGTHLDFFLQKGEGHASIPDAKVTAQVQLPDGSQKSLDMKYDSDGKHYTVLLLSQTTGEYKVAILSDINGKKVNGRFSFKK
ncbi:MAG: hypothetical protein KME35_07555 [Aphanocapsa sp. GSE-SYN-MK-11-07L]|jgi:hypothetical protein|nr:hypothetical protein [Aphanocapsa sp. GSE-SYN-MK-11-07L]